MVRLQIKYDNLTVVPLTTAATPQDIATALMGTWFPNNNLALPKPNLAIFNDKWGSCGVKGASVCAQSFLVERIGEYVYIQVH
jgi:hypothetical protein